MKTPAIFGAAAGMILAVAALGQTNTLPILYLHYGIGGGTSPKKILSSRIYLGETFFVGGGDYSELKGHIEKRGTNLFAEVRGTDGHQGDLFNGNITLEKPFSPQTVAGTVAMVARSGGFSVDHWFVVSTNSDCRAVVELSHFTPHVTTLVSSNIAEQFYRK
jgi:hypothetical protein